MAPTPSPSLSLGATSFLINGFQSVWDASSPSATPLYAATVQALNTKAIDLNNNGTSWGQLEITLCDTAEELLSQLNHYNVLFQSGDTASLPAGSLILNDTDKAASIASIKTLTGIDLSQDDGGYAFIAITRNEGTQNYPYSGNAAISSQYAFDFNTAVQGLEKNLGTGPVSLSALGKIMGNLGTADIQNFLDFFNRYGSHYVSQVTTGDVIYQIFSFNASDYATISAYYKANPDKLYGLQALSFEVYTNPKHQVGNNTFGYATQVGLLNIMSNDAAFAQSVVNGDWNDSNFSINSILMQLLGNVNLSTFTKVVPIALELTEVLDLMAFRTQMVGNRIFKSFAYAKYGNTISPDFRNIAQYDYDSIFPSDVLSGLISYLATTSINVYKEKIDLSEVTVVMPDEVQDFLLMAQVMQMVNADSFASPGSSVTLIAHTFDMSANNDATITLSDQAYDSLQLACQYFIGNLSINNTSGTKSMTIVDGFNYGLQNSTQYPGKSTVVLNGTVRNTPQVATLPSIATNIDFSLTVSEFILDAQAGTAQAAGQPLILDYLGWVASAIPAPTSSIQYGSNWDSDTSDTLSELKLRALYIARVAVQLRFQGISVPLLTFAAYTPMSDSLQNALSDIQTQIDGIQNQISARKLEEELVKDFNELEKAIAATGNEVACLIQAQMENEQLSADYYGSIIASQQNSLTQLQGNISTLSQSLALQQGVVGGLVSSLKDAVENYETMEILKSIVSVATDTFSLAKDIANPETGVITAIKDLITVAQDLQKLIKAIQTFENMDQSLGNIQDAINTLHLLGPNGVSTMSSEQWQEFSANFNTSINNQLAGINDNGVTVAKNNLINGFNILTIRGQALVTAQAQLQQLVTEIYLNQKRQQLSQQQAANFGKLPFKCQSQSDGQTTRTTSTNGGGSVDPATVDLMGLTSTLLSSQKRMGAMLARILMLQNSAIQYEYPESQPVSITDFDLVSLSQVIVAENANILAGIANNSSYFHPFNPGNQPVQYVVKGVPVMSLLNGNSFAFTIPLSASEFAGFDLVRVDQVVADISGVKSTGSGKYQIDLSYDGHPFWDRNKDGNVMTFHTPSRFFDFLFLTCQTGQSGPCPSGPATGNLPFGPNISPITPFSQWRIAIPDVSFNAGIDFGGATTVDITLSLYGMWYLPPNIRRMVDAGMSEEAINTAKFKVLALDAAAPAPPTEAEILSAMYNGGTIMNGWDAVFNLTESKVNQILANQWTSNNHAGTNFTDNIPLTTFFSSVEKAGGNSTITQFAMDLGAPEIQFQSNNTTNVALTMQVEKLFYGYGGVNISIIKSLLSSNQIPAAYVSGLNSLVNTVGGNGVSFAGACADLISILVNNNAIFWIDQPPTSTNPTPVSPPQYLNASVALDKLSGVVNGGSSSNSQMSVILNLAKGAFNTSNITISGNNQYFPIGIEQWMANNNIAFTINIIDLTNLSGQLLPSLTPNTFTFNTLTPNNGPAVLQIFIATGSDGLLNNPSTLVPNPIPDGQDVSLMINTKILYQDIFVKSYQAANNPNGFAVTAVAPSPGATGPASAYYGQLTGGAITINVPPGDHWRVSSSSNAVTIDFTGMTFKGTSAGMMSASYNEAHNNQDFSVQTTTTTMYRAKWTHWNSAHMDTNIVVGFGVPFALSGSGKTQTVQLNPNTAQITPTLTVTSISGMCTGKAKSRIQDELNSFAASDLPGPITNSTSIQFGSVSLFALESILFPAGNLIDLTSAYAPGDMIIFGTLNVSSDD
ncbi:MAG TPA: hypothetical protein PKA00_06160 [Saprospiraceae bacterium]|nr:hypothetical protein [Saprospiraceae bacterium]HMQ82468.1 hypothetical protein [Saprospiraceae bacterium]